MRKMIWLLATAAVFTPASALADMTGTDQFGKRIILRDDGTWSYAPVFNKRNHCINYGNKAVIQHRKNRNRGCGYSGSRWQSNFNNHFNWCLGVSKATSDSETRARRNLLAQCRNSGGGGGGGGGKTAICDAYARTAVSQHRINLNRGCGYSGTRWQSSYNNHFGWCLGVSTAASSSETRARRNLILQCGGGGGPARIKTFIRPKWNGHIVDNCVTWATNCGGGGAHNYCRLKGYSRASAWRIFKPGSTYVIGSNRVCRGAFCGGYATVTCAR